MTDMVRVELGGEVQEVPAAQWQAAADALHAKHGGIPTVTPIVDEVAPTQPAPPSDPPPVVPKPAGLAFSARKPTGGGLSFVGDEPLDVPAGRRDIVGQARSTLDAEATEAAGFAVAPPIFDRGTRVNDEGVRNAAASREEWERMPDVRANCEALAAQIAAEDREDSVALVTEITMAPNGSIVVNTVDGPGCQLTPYVVTERAFSALVTRMQIPAAGRYLRACWPELRAENVNAWIARMRGTERRAELAAAEAGRALGYTPLDVRLRTRKRLRDVIGGSVQREVFAAVGPAYADLDADKIAEAIALATPAGARGRVTYDGRRSRFEILFQSTVQPRHFVAGEFFRAGVIVDTDDTGGGSIAGHAVVWQNLCLNLVIVDVSRTAHFAIRHIGDVDAMAKRFREGFAKAMGSIDHFVTAWDAAVEDDVVARARAIAAADGRALPAKAEHVMAGIFRDAIERDLVPVRVAKTEDAVRGLLTAWESDQSGAAGPTRAAVVNAFTRYAHTLGTLDPWQEDEIQLAAGGLLRRATNGNGWARSLGFLAPEDTK